MRTARHAVLAVISLLPAISFVRPADAGGVASTLRNLDVTALSREERHDAAGMVARDIERRRLLAIQPENMASADFASRRTILREGWSRLLGNITPATDPIVKSVDREETNDVAVERIVLEVDPGIIIPLVVMQARDERCEPVPVVMALADSGKQKFLAARPDAVSTWLEAGCAVCLPDVRGTGETNPGSSHGPRSIGTTLSCRDQVLGQTLLGSRLRDLRSVLLFLRTRKGFEKKISLWGDSLAVLNPPERTEVVPYGVDDPNIQAEPCAGLLVWLTALFEDQVNAIYARGTYASEHFSLNVTGRDDSALWLVDQIKR